MEATMPSEDITKTSLESLINSNDLVIIDFWTASATTCSPLLSSYERLYEFFPLIMFASINIREQQELADLFAIQAVPHLMIFKKGIVIYSEAGILPEPVLKDLVQQALDVDISEIQAQIEEEKRRS